MFGVVNDGVVWKAGALNNVWELRGPLKDLGLRFVPAKDTMMGVRLGMASSLEAVRGLVGHPLCDNSLREYLKVDKKHTPHLEHVVLRGSSMVAT